MPKKRHPPEEIVAKLRQVDVLIALGRPLVEALECVGVPEKAYARWHSEYGGLARTLQPSRPNGSIKSKLR